MTQEFETATPYPATSAIDPARDGGVAIWKQLREALRGRLNAQAFATWITQITFVSLEGHTLTLGVPSIFTLDWINNHYRFVVDEELHKIAEEIKFELLIVGEEAAAAQQPELTSDRPAVVKEVKRSSASAQAADPAATSLNRRYTFSTFVTGPSNQLASAAAQQVADKPGLAYNPLFIFGRVGLGKTHLLQAIGHTILKRSASARVQYLTTEQFINDVIQGIRFDRMEEIRRTYRQCDVLLIDDIQFIAGKETCQTEFFHTFNALYDARKQVVVTSDKLPHEIKDLEERVKTRFQWGLIVDLQPPELETRVAIVRKKAENDGIPIDNDVAMFIAQSVRSNVRELEGSLIRISAYASLQNQPISVALAKDVLKDVLAGKGHVLTCEAIVKAVATHFDVKVSDLKSTKRGRAIALPRQVAMYLCRKHTSSSYPEIGQALGGKDHTTALNAFNRIKERLDTPEVRRHVEEIERLLLD